MTGSDAIYMGMSPLQMQLLISNNNNDGISMMIIMEAVPVKPRIALRFAAAIVMVYPDAFESGLVCVALWRGSITSPAMLTSAFRMPAGVIMMYPYKLESEVIGLALGL